MTTGTPQPDAPITRRELALLADVSERTIDRLARRGELPREQRLGRTVYYRLEDVTAWLAARAAKKEGL